MSKTMNSTKTIFEDPCYPPALVKRINYILDHRGSDALDKWVSICRAVFEMYSHADDDNKFEPTDINLSLETAPREVLLMIIMDRKVFRYRELMSQFGVVVPDTNK